MKANRLVFENAIDINPRSGIIKFNGNRMILKSAEALGFFRRDIIQTLNMERAKVFITIWLGMRLQCWWLYQENVQLEGVKRVN